MASQEGHEQVVEQLLSHGASVSLACHDHATPLFIAAQEGHNIVLVLLLAAGAVIHDQATRVYIARHIIA